MKKTRSKKKIIISVLCVLLALAVLTPCVINAVVMLSASKYIISADEAAGRGADCVLVLGAKVNSNGTLSHMLEDRMSTGVDLYQSGAGKKILASGDHGRDSYDEVNHMKQYAVGRGVDPDDVFLDHAGFSTYESMYRAHDVFEVKSAIVVTQKTRSTARSTMRAAWVSTPTAWRRTSAFTASPSIISCARASPGARTSLCAFSSQSRLISVRLSR